MARARGDRILRPKEVTVASRVMLPAYLILATWYGTVYLFDPFGRLENSHGLAFQRDLGGGSMEPWGLFFLALAAFLAVQMLRGSRETYTWGLCILAAIWIAWSGCYVVSMFQDDATSLTAPAPTLFYATAGIASALSLKAREV